MAKKIYVVGGSTGYVNWINDCVLVNQIDDADIVWFTGGADINPAIYNKELHYSTYYYDSRDEMELAAYAKAIECKIPLIGGTCRGLQLITALNGGILVQDVTHHCGSNHYMTNGVDTYRINSLHHQMCYPFNLPKEKYEILYWSSPSLSMHYHGITEEEESLITCEPEVIVYYTNEHTKCFGVQGHPEMLYYHNGQEHKTIGMLNKLVDKYLYD